MPTCGECAKNVGGNCKDTNTNGLKSNLPVSDDDESCTPGSAGWEGFKPRAVIEVKPVGQFLKEKIDEVEKKQVRNCGTCQKFKGPNEACGQTYDNGLRMVKYTPAAEIVGPCMEGYAPKVNLTNPEQLVSEKVQEAKGMTTCFDCDLFSGKGSRCKDGIHVANNLQFKCDDFKHKSPFSILVAQYESSPYQFAGEVLKPAYIKTTPQKKETSTMSNAIIRLADSQLNKQIEDFGGLSLDIKDALADLQAQERKESAQAAAKEIVDVLKLSNIQIEYQVGFIRDARRQEEAAKKKIEAVNRAKAYGLETNNFIPLGILVGEIYPHHVHNKDLIEVPKDWQPKAKAEVAAQ